MCNDYRLKVDVDAIAADFADLKDMSENSYTMSLEGSHVYL